MNFNFSHFQFTRNEKKSIFVDLSLPVDLYILDNENKGQIKVYISTLYKMPNYMECEDSFEDEQKIRFVINPDSPAKFLYLGVCSRYSQPISIKPIYGQFAVAKQKKRRPAFTSQHLIAEKAKKSKPDIFQKANERLFSKMGEEERAELIRDIMRKRQRKIYELAKGKDYIALNRDHANLFRVSKLKRKYVQNIVG